MPRAGDDYASVLTAAVNDLAEHGFDRAERVAHWQRLLKEAADRTLASPEELERMYRQGMHAIYDRLVGKEQVLQRHPGVSRFTLQRLGAQLRPLLDRHIMASADLIRLNRQQMVTRTLQRFSGWATSIPAGGGRVDRRKEKAHIKKALSSLPFEERRVMIDQGHKLTAAISEVIAEDGGAIALAWRSHWRQPGYNYRPDHKERDGRVYLLRSSWARSQGLVKPGPAGLYEDVTSVGQEPFCRCYAVYIYALRSLPAEMLTKKGERVMAEARRAAEALTA